MYAFTIKKFSLYKLSVIHVYRLSAQFKYSALRSSSSQEGETGRESYLLEDGLPDIEQGKSPESGLNINEIALALTNSTIQEEIQNVEPSTQDQSSAAMEDGSIHVDSTHACEINVTLDTSTPTVTN